MRSDHPKSSSTGKSGSWKRAKHTNIEHGCPSNTHSRPLLTPSSGPGVRPDARSLQRRTREPLVEALGKLCAGEPVGVWQRQGGFHLSTHEFAKNLGEQLKQYGAPLSAALVSWSRPHYHFDAPNGLIYYPDMDDTGVELLAFHASLLPGNTQHRAREVLIDLSPLLITQEVFRHWRWHCRRLTGDKRHEEYIAKRLAISFLLKYHPEAVYKTQTLALEIVTESRRQLQSASLKPPTISHQKYLHVVPGQASPAQLVVWQMQMTLDLLDEAPSLDSSIGYFLSEASPSQLAAPPASEVRLADQIPMGGGLNQAPTG